MAMKTARRSVLLLAVLAPGLVAAAQAEEIQTMQPVPIERTAPISTSPMAPMELKGIQPVPTERLSPMSRPSMPLTEIKTIQPAPGERGVREIHGSSGKAPANTPGVAGQSRR